MRTRQFATKNIISGLLHPSVSRGLYIGLTAWLLFLSFYGFRQVEVAVTTLGNQWAQQGQEWSEPVRAVMYPVRAFLEAYAFPIGVIGLVWSLLDLVRGKEWALLGILLAVTLPVALKASMLPV